MIMVQEQEEILATFKVGRAMCLSALLSLLSAIIGIVLMIVNICISIIDISIGILMCVHAGSCMIKSLLSLCKDIAELEATERRIL